MAFALGSLFGLSLAAFIAWRIDRSRDKLSLKTTNDVKELMRHFACGQGYVGCNGGPKCPWDHK